MIRHLLMWLDQCPNETICNIELKCHVPILIKGGTRKTRHHNREIMNEEYKTCDVKASIPTPLPSAFLHYGWHVRDSCLREGVGAGVVNSTKFNIIALQYYDHTVHRTLSLQYVDHPSTTIATIPFLMTVCGNTFIENAMRDGCVIVVCKDPASMYNTREALNPTIADETFLMASDIWSGDPRLFPKLASEYETNFYTEYCLKKHDVVVTSLKRMVEVCDRQDTMENLGKFCSAVMFVDMDQSDVKACANALGNCWNSRRRPLIVFCQKTL